MILLVFVLVLRVTGETYKHPAKLLAFINTRQLSKCVDMLLLTQPMEIMILEYHPRTSSAKQSSTYTNQHCPSSLFSPAAYVTTGSDENTVKSFLFEI